MRQEQHESVEAFVDSLRRRIWIALLQLGADLSVADDADRRITEVVHRLDLQPVDGVVQFQPILDALEDEFGFPRGSIVQIVVDKHAAVVEAEDIIRGGQG